MKTRYVVIPIVMVAVLALAAFSTPAMAACVCDVATSGCPCACGTNGSLNGTVYVDGDGSSELGQNYEFVDFEDIPADVDIKWARVYWHVWGGTLSNTGWSNATFCNETQCWENNRSITSTCQQSETDGWYKGGCGTHWVYWNVTNNVSTGSNNITVDNTNGDWDGSTMWVYMVAVLENTSKYSKMNYTINQGYEDLAKSSKSTTWFNGSVTTNPKRNGTLWHLGLASHGDFKILFNNHEVYNYPNLGGDYMDLEELEIDSGDIEDDDNTQNMTWDNSDSDDFHPVMAIFMDTRMEDLIVTDIDVGTPRPNNAFTVEATIKNRGVEDAGAFDVSLYINGSYNQKNTSITGLNGGASTTVSFPNVNLPKGCHDFKVVADCDGDIPESNENNNATTVKAHVGYVIVVESYHDFDDLVTESEDELLGAGNVSHSGNTYYIKNFTGSSAIVNWAGDGITIKNLNATTKFEINNCTIENCTGSGVYFYNLSNGTINGSKVQNNTIKYGIYVGSDSKFVNITNNTLDKNNYGMLLWKIGTANSTVKNNNITNSTKYGIYIYGNYTNITNNTIQNNSDYGLKSYKGYHNNIHCNTFIDNNVDYPARTSQAWDNRNSNHWNSTELSKNYIGNRWNDWDDNSGFPCNYTIDGGSNVDKRPKGLYDFLTGESEDKWAYGGKIQSLPTVPNDPNTEFTSTDYTKISQDDGIRKNNYAGWTNGYYGAHRFNFSIDETAPEKINVTWHGRGNHTRAGVTDGAKLYIYNFTDGNYTLWGSTTLDTYVYLTNETTSNISNYISSSNNVTILVNQTSPSDGYPADGKRSYIFTDYVKLVVTIDP